MKNQQHRSVSASTTKIVLGLALVSVSAILLTSTSQAASAISQPNQSCGRIDTVDAYTTELQFLGYNLLTGCALTAADANAGPGLNTTDVLAIQRFYLGFTVGRAGTDTGCGLCYGDVASATNSPLPGVTISLPTTNLDTSIAGSTIIFVPVVTTTISNVVGFQGDFTFDERVITFSSGNGTRSAGLTANPWNVSAFVLPGVGPFRTLRISAWAPDPSFALSGSGTLFEFRMLRVSNTPGDTTNLIWINSPDDFQFIDVTRNTLSPTQTNGQITITSNPTPTPGPATPTPTPAPPTPTRTPTPIPTASPTPGPPLPSPTPRPGSPTVTAPTFSMDTSDGFAINDQAVTTTTITPSLDGNGNCTDNSTCLIGFQADITFDSAVAVPSPRMNAAAPAGLTASGWSVGSNILNTGPGTIQTLRVSGYVTNGNTPLSGAGTLFVVHWKRVSSNPGDSTALTWRAFPDAFQFVDTDLDALWPPQNNGLITITEQTPNSVNLSGTISYCSNMSAGPVPDVPLSLTGTESASAMSNGSGNYTFSSIAAGGNYTVTPGKSALAPASAGITTADVIAVQRHYLNIALITSGCRLTAADVDRNGAVDTLDVVAIQRFFMGRAIGIGNVGQFQFSPASRTYSGVMTDQTNQNYDAFVIGDVAPPFVE